MMFAFLFLSCQHKKPLQTLAQVNLEKYVGKRHEIAAIPQKFQKGCHCTTAEFTLTSKGYIKAVNSCRKDSVTGPVKQIMGKAFINKQNPAKLKVQFFGRLKESIGLLICQEIFVTLWLGTITESTSGYFQK